MSIRIATVPTAPIAGQKTGTSGLRRKVAVFQQPHYLANWVQSLFTSLEGLGGSTLALGGDGRYWNSAAIDIICRIAAGNGVARVLVGRNGILCTPAMSAVIRARKLLGGLILTASHNPGGVGNDWGIKFNGENGGPATEAVTGRILEETKRIKEYTWAVKVGSDGESPFAAMDWGKVGEVEFVIEGDEGGKFVIEVIDPVEDYLRLLQQMFDFDKLRALFRREDFSFLFDAMSGVTGPYAEKIFVDVLGGKESWVMRGTPLEDFGGGHPDPNLTYAAELVSRCNPKSGSAPEMGAASDGDGDRNMILGKGFFVTPSDSVAVIAAECKKCIPYFKKGLKGVARSMPTAGALDRVAKKMSLEMYETPTGWKYFGNLMDADKAQICGEESFGTGSDHLREKDGIFAVLCWLSILAYENEGNTGKFVGIEHIVKDHWKTYGRNFFSRYDYEEVDGEAAQKMIAHVAEVQQKISKSLAEGKTGAVDGADEKLTSQVVVADDFEYRDPVDGSVATGQGKRFIFEDGSRIIFRLSGTGSSGATIRMYVEKYEESEERQSMDAQEALKPLIGWALQASKLKEFTGREKPTVIT